jgi:dCTP deaminase
LILTGPEITAAAVDGRVRISPFSSDQVNPNSYNVRLGPTLLVYTCDVLDAHHSNPTETITIGEHGYVLQPGELYLGHTLEEVGSDLYVPLLFGRSSVGRLGLFVEITAPIGDIGFHGQWTLMLSPVRPLRVYAGMEIGQIMFVVSTGTVDLYTGKYQASTGPQASRYWHDVHLTHPAPGRPGRRAG